MSFNFRISNAAPSTESIIGWLRNIFSEYKRKVSFASSHAKEYHMIDDSTTVKMLPTGILNSFVRSAFALNDMLSRVSRAKKPVDLKKCYNSDMLDIGILLSSDCKSISYKKRHILDKDYKEATPTKLGYTTENITKYFQDFVKCFEVADEIHTIKAGARGCMKMVLKPKDKDINKVSVQLKAVWDTRDEIMRVWYTQLEKLAKIVR